MENRRGLGLRLIFVCVFLFATTYTCLGIGNVSVICSEHERLALLNFKHSIQDPFEMLSSWVGNECCMWEGIQCDGVTGNVQRLKLNADSYYDFFTRNKVSSSLAELRHLKYLDLSGNGFFLGSQIPEFIGSFKQLTYLNLFDAGFEGIIPPQIGNLSNLKMFDCGLDRTHLSSPRLNFSTLSNIQHLDLSYNPLGGIFLSFLTNMSSLRVLDLSDTMLNSSLPIMPKLLELHLDIFLITSLSRLSMLESGDSATCNS
uniref:Leucine-rich repeat-containing N-terminal plant-type domain-containing protein n=1 Tax=Lactuca sativa TaxID=4236 RepID=A0A9R1WUC8_LACSA|nr:hypothetical protein LSAT_V11C800409960 [Lactuca sativa]